MAPLIASALSSAAAGVGKGIGDAISGADSGPSITSSQGSFDNSGFSVATGGGSVKATLEKTSSSGFEFNQNTLIVGGLVLMGLFLITKMRKR